MLTATCNLVGMSPLGFSAPIQSPKNTGESDGAWEDRVWREKMHTDKNGEVFLTPMALKNCLTSAAAFKSEKIKGAGNQTWTKHFKSGIMVPSPITLGGVKAETADRLHLFVPSDGKTGGGKRVWKNFPILPEWTTDPIEIVILDEKLIASPGKLEEYLVAGGLYIGLGFFRPERNGYFGRYRPENFKVVK